MYNNADVDEGSAGSDRATAAPMRIREVPDSSPHSHSGENQNNPAHPHPCLFRPAIATTKHGGPSMDRRGWIKAVGVSVHTETAAVRRLGQWATTISSHLLPKKRNGTIRVRLTAPSRLIRLDHGEHRPS